MGSLEISVLVSTYQRPGHLYRCLQSLARQENVQDLFEVVITDDGSTDETFHLVEYFAGTANFPIKYTTHPHGDFQLSRCRNEGIAVASAPYILITDGDCIFPRDHLSCHLQFRRPGFVVAGDCYRLSELQSSHVDEVAIESGNFRKWIDPQERKRIRWKALRAFVYSHLHLKMLPRLTGSNIAAWRSDLHMCNGFDENFVGWGLEDRDLQRRLAKLGIRSRSILYRTAAYHLWHPPAPSFVRNNVGTHNLTYYQTHPVTARCTVGLAERMSTTTDLLAERLVLAHDRPSTKPPRFIVPELRTNLTLKKIA